MAAETLRKQQADETRERLLALAWDRVRAEGAAAFTMRRLAEEAGVAVGLPFAHFGSRDALLDDLRLRAWDRIDEAIEAAIGAERAAAAPGDYERIARRGVEAVVAFALAEPHVYDLVIYTPGMVVSDRVLARDIETARRFIAFLMEGEARGAFRFTDGPIVFALALWTSVQGYLQRMRAVTAPFYREHQQRVLAVILDSFFTPARAPGAEGGR